MFTEDMTESMILGKEALERVLAITVETFDMQANTSLVAEAPFLKEARKVEDISIVAILTMQDGNHHGKFSLYSSEEVFLRFYNNFFEENNTTFSSDMSDAISEILNIIYGQVKFDFNKEYGLSLEPSLPSIILGSNLDIETPGEDVNPLIIPLKMDGGYLYLEICLQKNKEVARVS